MPQGSVTTELNIAGSYAGTQVSMDEQRTRLATGSSATSGLISMSALRYTQAGTQQANLIGTGSVNTPSQGNSIALSADGNTLAVSGPQDNSGIGATWIFTRSGTTWTQQGSKLVGTGAATAQQGTSVALSADGNTLAVGGMWDNNGNTGATWIFTRSGTTWTQQGNKLVGTGSVGTQIFQGASVSLSADGNTLAVGGYNDNSNKGATWIFTRSGTTWSQQGSKLFGTGSVGTQVYQGFSVSLSADGNTLAVGGYVDNSANGATWVFTRSGTTWTQQGSKLVGTGNTGTANQGTSVSLSADGNTLAVGGPQDNSQRGAVWIFTRSGTTWTQQGSKLVGTGNTGTRTYQGFSVSLSADGNVLVFGGYGDAAGNPPFGGNGRGAAWIFTRTNATWTQQGSKLVGPTGGDYENFGWSVSIAKNGNTIAVGAPRDQFYAGSSWVYV